MKYSRILLGGILLVFVGAAFLLLHFQAMSSRTSANSTIASSRSGDAATPWIASPAVTGLYVEGTGKLEQSIRAEVKRQLQGQPRTGEITDMNAPADQVDIPQIYIQVIPVRHFWTPFYARSEYRLEVSYASNGDISFRKQDTTRFKVIGDQPVMQYQASLTLQDTSWGIISAPGYRDYLAGRMTAFVVESFQKQTQ